MKILLANLEDCGLTEFPGSNRQLHWDLCQPRRPTKQFEIESTETCSWQKSYSYNKKNIRFFEYSFKTTVTAFWKFCWDFPLQVLRQLNKPAPIRIQQIIDDLTTCCGNISKTACRAGFKCLKPLRCVRFPLKCPCFDLSSSEPCMVSSVHQTRHVRAFLHQPNLKPLNPPILFILLHSVPFIRFRWKGHDHIDCGAGRGFSPAKEWTTKKIMKWERVTCESAVSCGLGAQLPLFCW